MHILLLWINPGITGVLVTRGKGEKEMGRSFYGLKAQLSLLILAAISGSRG
ncbi:hypothetical protein [Sinomicrobium sp.]